VRKFKYKLDKSHEKLAKLIEATSVQTEIDETLATVRAHR
jgi:hypothetical protein